MTMSAISITAILQAKPSKEDLLREELVKVVAPSRAERGCIRYILHQSVEDDGIFIFNEIWEDEEALNLHIQTDHYRQYRNNTEELVGTRQVYRLHEIRL